MSSSSAAYRRALRWYPAAWRERNSESAISAYLDRDDAIGTSGPTRSDWVNLARAGIIETFVATVRRPRLGTTVIGAFFLLAAWSLAAVALDVGRRALLVLITGVVNFHTSMYPNPVLATVGLGALAWMSAAVVALRRHRALAAGAILLCGLTSTAAFWLLWWSGPLTPLQLQSAPRHLSLLSIVALAAPILAIAAAARAGLVQRRARWFVGAGGAGHVVGVWGIAVTDPPSTIVSAVIAVAFMLLAPASFAITGASFVFLSTTDRSRPLSPGRADQLSSPSQIPVSSPQFPWGGSR
ncbi:hypothetical protein [Rathayibacter sp. VKM Ac-2857]|uniref:hypothetical protein n=1 Tax=Rathayibacter sp. VKM Ac-2857 TaxID=2739020 RepID=UPI00156582A1|nr:hypothetical protein [Rathayibacter sp. VKM Ac-2857]NQX17979.1 hypothetical protein [Rathayibacter sp. VKM Ac-2857]